MNLIKIQKLIADFAIERDWEQFHNPKNLVMALIVEAAELVEIFQWKTPSECESMSDKELDNVRDEVADVIVYLLRLCDLLNIDIEKAITQKMEKNAQKYPVEKARGSSVKYNKL